MAFKPVIFIPPFLKGGRGGIINNTLTIPLNPPYKGGLKEELRKITA
jgi:hypothetical protein